MVGGAAGPRAGPRPPASGPGGPNRPRTPAGLRAADLALRGRKAPHPACVVLQERDQDRGQHPSPCPPARSPRAPNGSAPARRPGGAWRKVEGSRGLSRRWGAGGGRGTRLLSKLSETAIPTAAVPPAFVPLNDLQQPIVPGGRGSRLRGQATTRTREPLARRGPPLAHGPHSGTTTTGGVPHDKARRQHAGWSGAGGSRRRCRRAGDSHGVGPVAASAPALTFQLAAPCVRIRQRTRRWRAKTSAHIRVALPTIREAEWEIAPQTVGSHRICSGSGLQTQSDSILRLKRASRQAPLAGRSLKLGGIGS